MATFKLIISYIYLSIILSSCGFKPLYSDNSIANNKDNQLSSIILSTPVTIEQAEFYSEFNRLLPVGKTPKYNLKVSFNISSAPQIILRNSDTLREVLNMNVNYQLEDTLTNKILYSDYFFLNSSYNCIFSPYINYLENDNIKKTLYISAAHKIRDRLILYFNNKINMQK